MCGSHKKRNKFSGQQKKSSERICDDDEWRKFEEQINALTLARAFARNHISPVRRVGLMINYANEPESFKAMDENDVPRSLRDNLSCLQRSSLWIIFCNNFSLRDFSPCVSLSLGRCAINWLVGALITLPSARGVKARVCKKKYRSMIQSTGWLKKKLISNLWNYKSWLIRVPFTSIFTFIRKHPRRRQTWIHSDKK